MNHHHNANVAYESAVPARNPTELENIREQISIQVSRARDISMTLSATVNRLRGQHPSKDATGAPSPVPNGVLEELRQSIADLDRMQTLADEMLRELVTLV